MKNTLSVFVALIFTYSSFAQRITVTVAGIDNLATGQLQGIPGPYAKIGIPLDVCVDGKKNVYFTTGVVSQISSHDGRVRAVAGGGTSTSDGIPATTARLNCKSICTDAAGNLYLGCGNQIKRVDAVTNILTTVAGNGGFGSTGDGGPATAATFTDIKGICIDRFGNLYLADEWNHCVRKISAVTNIVTRVAGTGTKGYSGDGGPGTLAELDSPYAVSTNNAGDVFIVDQGDIHIFNSVIRKVDAITGFITTTSGGGPGGLYDCKTKDAYLGFVTGICINNSGDWYFNEVSCLCRKNDAHSDSVFAVGGNFGIEAYSDDTNSNYAYMNFPYGICVDGSDNLFIADSRNERIRKLIPVTSVPTFAYGEGQSIDPCTATPSPIDKQLAVTDMDYLQTETWSVIAAPINGSLVGFPFSKLSSGPDNLLIPSGLQYVPKPGFSGADSFVIRVSDGIYADTITIFASVSPQPSGSITPGSGSSVCLGKPALFSETYKTGTWSLTQPLGAIDPLSGILNTWSLGTDTVIFSAPTYRCLVHDTSIISIITTPPPITISGADSVCKGSMVTMISGSTGTWSVSNTNAIITTTGVLSGVMAGKDTVFFTQTNVCGNVIDKKTIRIDSILFLDPITGPDNVCEKASIVLSDATPGGTWNTTNSNGTISGYGLFDGVIPGIDTINYSITNACGTATVSATVLINSLPPVGPIYCDSSICLGATTTLSNAVTGGIWTQVNGLGFITGSGTLTGMYIGTDTIIYITSNSCGTASATKEIKIIDCIALSAGMEKYASMNLFPNPAFSILNIQWNGFLNDNDISVTDIVGREVLHEEFHSDMNTQLIRLDVSSLGSGVYFLRVNGSLNQKFMKE